MTSNRVQQQAVGDIRRLVAESGAVQGAAGRAVIQSPGSGSCRLGCGPAYGLSSGARKA